MRLVFPTFSYCLVLCFVGEFQHGSFTIVGKCINWKRFLQKTKKIKRRTKPTTFKRKLTLKFTGGRTGGKTMRFWQIVAIFGTVIFFFSGFLDLFSSFFYAFSLLDFYEWEMGMKSPFKPGLPSSLSAIYLTMILYPVAIMLGVLLTVIRKRSLALAAGSVGVVGWACALAAISNVRYAQIGGTTITVAQYGIGIFVGLIGAGILLASGFLPSYMSTVSKPRQPLPAIQHKYCTVCGAELVEEDVYCRKCGAVVPSQDA
jgi:hypothetical protein